MMMVAWDHPGVGRCRGDQCTTISQVIRIRATKVDRATKTATWVCDACGAENDEIYCLERESPPGIVTFVVRGGAW